MASYDYIIVGGGASGLVLAARLTEDSSKRVLVLEAGDDLTGDARLAVPAMWPTLLNTDVDWKFKTVPQDALNGREMVFPQGRLLGGTSAINSFTFTPTSKANVDAWGKLGNTGWDWESFSKSWEKSFTLASQPSRGSGPLQLSFPNDTDDAWPKIWEDTMSTLGFPVDGDPYTGQAYGALRTPDSIQPASKTRSYSVNAYLEPARGRENLTVITKAPVDKVTFNKNGDVITATGVQYTLNGETKTATGNEVIITAGAINTPKILELSGIGDAIRLRKLGIDVVIDNPNVGENLQNHVMAGLSFETVEGEKTIDQLSRQDPVALGAAMEAYKKQLGPFARSGTNATAQLPMPGINTPEGKAEIEKLIAQYTTSFETESNATFAKLQIEFVRSVLTSSDQASGIYISFPGYASFGTDGNMTPPPAGSETYFSIALLLSHPLSRGSVHITSASPSQPGLAIDPKYLSHPLDLEVFARQLRYAECIVNAEPLASHLKAGGKRNANAPAAGASLEEAKNYLRRAAVGSHHFTGTCSMMARNLGGVVDSQLRVYGARNLRVADASIIPLTPRANPQATVYGVAEHAAEIIKSGL